MSVMLELALALAAEGWHVFPVKPGRKSPPMIKNWQEEATTDPVKIRQMWAIAGPDGNPAIACNMLFNGQHIVVVDADVKNGARGSESLDILDLFYGEDDWMKTRTVRTPSGGLHLYFLTATPLGSLTASASHAPLGLGIDVRAGGPHGRAGYVLAPGAVTAQGNYTLAGTGEMRLLLPAIASLIVPAPRKKAQVTLLLTGADAETARQRVIEHLQHAPAAVERAGGDATTYQVACQVRDYGVSETEALDLMAEHWNPNCAPAWDYADLAEKVGNAYRYARKEVGSGVAMRTDFTPVAANDRGAVSRPAGSSRLQFERFSEIRWEQAPRPLITRWLDNGALSVIYGRPNAGKSFLALDIAYHVATGTRWYGETVEQGAVVYVAAESPGSIRRRLVGLRRYYDQPDIPLVMVSCPIDLRSRNGDTEDLIGLINTVGDAYGVPVRLIVFDTLARVIAGGDENSGQDMGALIANADHLRHRTGCHVALIHHAGKEESRGARGWSGLSAAVDTEILVKDMTATLTKQRDGETGLKVGFALEKVSLAVLDTTGFPESVPVVVHQLAASTVPDVSLTGPARELLDLLGTVMGTHGQAPPAGLDVVPDTAVVAVADWRAAFLARWELSDRKGGQQVFRRQMARLVEAEQVCEQRGYAWPARGGKVHNLASEAFGDTD
ncbi:MAG: Uncharacterized protein FD153_1167 [Rhodospirillaceae bacterium]|nr:MAG: Uncharacterized protein FD153_1167 [Rhodospirillaceae bacterium]